MGKKGVVKGEVLNLIDLAGYQEGAVVSRTIIDEPVGTVTTFAFAEGEGLSEHTVPFDAMVQVLDGEAQITIDGVPHTVKTGEMIVMPGHKPHLVRAIKQFKMLLVMIRNPGTEA